MNGREGNCDRKDVSCKELLRYEIQNMTKVLLWNLQIERLSLAADIVTYVLLVWITNVTCRECKFISCFLVMISWSREYVI